MTTSCAALSQRYAQETGKAIPLPTAPVQDRSDWLLTQTWGCVLPGETVEDFHCGQVTDDYPNCDTSFCSRNNNSSGVAGDVLNRPPMLNYLKEDGFLHWVNQRGLQCVNRIVGNFYGFNPTTGNANVPSVSVSVPDSQCWGACFQVSSTSDMCFECVNQTLLANPSLCPELDPSNPDDESLIRDSVNCHECIGGQGSLMPVNNANNAAIIDNMWQCITGEVKPALTTAEIAILVVVLVFVLAIVLVLGLYYGYFHPKIVRQEQQRRQLMSAGLSPEDL